VETDISAAPRVTRADVRIEFAGASVDQIGMRKGSGLLWSRYA
jgi:hypothetical protein